jgi:hypothetical protein
MGRICALLLTGALLGALLVLTGCGGGAALAGSSASDAMGLLTVRADGPATAADSRLIPYFTYAIDVEVTAPDMPEPITGTITRQPALGNSRPVAPPSDSITLAVPIGTNRTITLYAKDIDGIRLASVGRKTGINVAPRVENTVNITLAGVEDLTGTPVELVLSGPVAQRSVEAVIECRNDLQRDDQFYFAAIGGQQYTVSFKVLSGAANTFGDFECTTEAWESDTMLANMVSSSSILYPFQQTSMTFTPAADGPVDLSVAMTPNSVLSIYYVLSVTESGTAGTTVTAD